MVGRYVSDYRGWRRVARRLICYSAGADRLKPFRVNHRSYGRGPIIHVHVGAINALVFVATLIIVGTTFRLIETSYPESVIGKALQFIY